MTVRGKVKNGKVLLALSSPRGFVMRYVACGLVLVGGTLLASFSGSAGAEEFKLEPGFTLLFNGKNLDGWKTKKGGAALDGMTEAYQGRFKVKDEILVIDPKVKGDVVIDTAKALKGDLHIKFDFLPGPGCNNDLFLRGLKFDLIPKTVKSIKQDEWNEFEIVVTSTKVVYKCNGVIERTSTAKVESSPFGIRAEYGPIQFRRIRIKETP